MATETKKTSSGVTRPADECLAELVEAATNDTIRTRLRHLHETCRSIVVDSRQLLSVPELRRRYHAAVLDESLSIGEQTLRNKRGGKNPYLTLYRKWQGVANQMLMLSPRRPMRPEGIIIHDGDIRSIEDPVLRHQVFMLLAENRSQRNQLNTLKQYDASVPLKIEGRRIDGGDLTLTDVELDAICDFISVRKLGGRHLQVTRDDGVRMRDGRIIADPGFFTALKKIARGYGRS